MIAEAECKGLIVGFENLAKKCLDVFLVLLDEFFLASAFVDDEADAERELVVVCEEADFLRDAILDDGEVVLGQTGDDAAVSVADAERGVDEVGLDFDDRDPLSVGNGCKEKQERDQKRELRHYAAPPLRRSKHLAKRYVAHSELFRSKKRDGLGCLGRVFIFGAT